MIKYKYDHKKHKQNTLIWASHKHFFSQYIRYPITFGMCIMFQVGLWYHFMTILFDEETRQSLYFSVDQLMYILIWWSTFCRAQWRKTKLLDLTAFHTGAQDSITLCQSNQHLLQGYCPVTAEVLKHLRAANFWGCDFFKLPPVESKLIDVSWIILFPTPGGASWLELHHPVKQSIACTMHSASQPQKWSR